MRTCPANDIFFFDRNSLSSELTKPRPSMKAAFCRGYNSSIGILRIGGQTGVYGLTISQVIRIQCLFLPGIGLKLTKFSILLCPGLCMRLLKGILGEQFLTSLKETDTVFSLHVRFLKFSCYFGFARHFAGHSTPHARWPQNPAKPTRPFHLVWTSVWFPSNCR